MGERPTKTPESVVVLPPWLAFVTAGVCGAAAGYLLTTADDFRRAYEGLGIELPWLTTVVSENDVGVPVVLLLAAAGLLGLGGWRVREGGGALAAARGLVAPFAVVAASAALLCVTSNVMAFWAVSKALQY